MPEGPEMRRAADRLRRAIGGRIATRVAFAFPHLRKHERHLSGQEVTAVETRGKALLVRFANDRVIYSHNQLYGRWYVQQAGRRPRTNRSLRLAIHNEERSALLYSASEIDVLRLAELDRHPFLSKLGPDALDPELTERALEERLAERRFQRRRLSALLLDQAFVAGIGNYLRSEILFDAGLHPELRPGDLDADQRRALASSIRRVTRLAYRKAGVTNDPERVVELKSQGMRRRDYRHHVFTRGGQRCWTCATVVQRIDPGGRQLYFCPRCQPAASAGRGRRRAVASRGRRR